MKKIFLYPLWTFLSILRFLNLLEPGDGTIPGRDYFPILSWSKITRIVGLGLVVMLFLSGVEIDIEAVVALLTYAGGEISYRYRQHQEKGSQNVDDPDQGDK